MFHIPVTPESQWNKAIEALEGESIKLAGYDQPLLENIGNVTNFSVLDYGCGPGVLATTLQRLGADVRCWDINPDMRAKAATKIGAECIYTSLEQIPEQKFDVIVCNLVLCIVEEDVVREILGNIRRFLAPGGRVFIGFCNPHLWQTVETQLDIRQPSGHDYLCNHSYSKIKKEGGYTIEELHRAIEWYLNELAKAGFRFRQIHFTPGYEFLKKWIHDFAVVEAE